MIHISLRIWVSRTQTVKTSSNALPCRICTAIAKVAERFCPATQKKKTFPPPSEQTKIRDFITIRQWLRLTVDLLVTLFVLLEFYKIASPWNCSNISFVFRGRRRYSKWTSNSKLVDNHSPPLPFNFLFNK